MSEPREAVRAPVYHEADQWHHRPLNLEMCRHLGEQDVAGRTVLHARPGFKGRGQVKPRTLVGAGGKLLLVVTFIDSGEHVRGVLPHIREMAPHRLIASERVALDSGEFE